MPPAIRVAIPERSRRLAALATRALLLALLALPAAPRAHAAPGGPASISAYTNAAMIPPSPGRAKEFALLRANGLFHMFYMRDNLLVPQDSTEREFGHAVSTDLVHWTQLAWVLPVRPGKWDNGHVWAPHVVEQDGIFYMWYTGVTMVPFSWKWYQRIGVATSTDLMNWTRYDQPVYGGDRVPWAFADSSTFDGAQFRDPYVMPDPDHPGQWLMFYVTEPAAARGQLIVGAARNAGGLTPWQDLGTPFWCTDAAQYWGWVESPNVFKHGSLWYLFCTTNSGHVLSFRTSPTLTTDSTSWSFRYRLYDMVNQDPLSDSWFGVEHLNLDGHDYLAWVNPYDSGIDIAEMVWGPVPTFSLRSPALAGIEAGPAPSALALTVLGRAAGDAGTVLQLALPEPGTARLELYDVAGRRVRTLVNGPLPRGTSLVTWDGRGETGGRVARGIYFARLVTPSAAATARVLVTG